VSAQPEAITPAFLRERSLPQPGDSKHARGTALVVGGSPATPGAIVLAGLAALRAGAGVLTAAVPRSIAVPLAVGVPEAGVASWDDRTPDEEPDLSPIAEKVAKSASVLVGPGLDDPDLTRRIVEMTLDNLDDEVPLVLDAYALGVLPDIGDRLANEGLALVLTPNHAEAARLLEVEVEQTQNGDDVEIATELAERWRATIVYQGVVAAEGHDACSVGTGGGGLGTSGSGDVLAGALAGLLARGADLHSAACWATYLHSAAGDRLAARVGKVGFLARELLPELPRVISEVEG